MSSLIGQSNGPMTGRRTLSYCSTVYWYNVAQTFSKSKLGGPFHHKGWHSQRVVDPKEISI